MAKQRLHNEHFQPEENTLAYYGKDYTLNSFISPSLMSVNVIFAFLHFSDSFLTKFILRVRLYSAILHCVFRNNKAYTTSQSNRIRQRNWSYLNFLGAKACAYNAKMESQNAQQNHTCKWALKCQEIVEKENNEPSFLRSQNKSQKNFEFV